MLISPGALCPVMVKSKPFLKWAGGKRSLVPKIRDCFPREFNGYFEPFVGGGAILFDVLSRDRVTRVVAGDTNGELVNCYRVVRDEVDVLVDYLREHDRLHCEEHYYAVRGWDRDGTNDTIGEVGRAARTVYLNKTCFNGLYRVNRTGYFNTPMGRYVKPAICDEGTLRAASEALARVVFIEGDFERCLESAGTRDLIYLDPPYQPVSPTANFTSYAKDGFDEAAQVRLRRVFSDLDERGCFVILSNSAAPFVFDLYHGYDIRVVEAGRAINSRASGRGVVNEVMVLGKTLVTELGPRSSMSGSVS